MKSDRKWFRSTAIGVATVALIAGAAGLWLWTDTTEPPVTRIDANDPGLVALGRTVYMQNCASCHGAKLEGQPDWRVRKPDGKLPAPPHDESGHTWHHADQQIFGLTRDGLKPPLAPEGYQSDMPAFGDVLTDDQIIATLAFIKSTWPAPIRARQTRIDEAVRKQADFKGEKK
tara:strand:- start:43 stop:561 length:519 start_codon:yes stop_codon:yes gene_type:complete